jgi:competence protein ComEC
MNPKTIATVYLIYFILRFLFGVVSNSTSEDGRSYLSIKVLDVGQGDAILITTPNKKRILIDGGPNFEVDAYLHDEMFLKQCYLDVVVLTHPHQDHEEGLIRSLRRCKAGVYKSLYKGDTFYIDGVMFYVLWPEKSYKDKDLNNISIVILLDYGDFEALFTGDVSGKLYKRMDMELLERTIDGPLDYYKVSHHGSRTGLDANFFTKYPPLNSVIPVGEGNRFGHPHIEVLEFFDSLGSKIYRTDLQGTVEFKIPVKVSAAK